MTLDPVSQFAVDLGVPVDDVVAKQLVRFLDPALGLSHHPDISLSMDSSTTQAHDQQTVGKYVSFQQRCLLALVGSSREPRYLRGNR